MNKKLEELIFIVKNKIKNNKDIDKLLNEIYNLGKKEALMSISDELKSLIELKSKKINKLEADIEDFKEDLRKYELYKK